MCPLCRSSDASSDRTVAVSARLDSIAWRTPGLTSSTNTRITKKAATPTIRNTPRNSRIPMRTSGHHRIANTAMRADRIVVARYLSQLCPQCLDVRIDRAIAAVTAIRPAFVHQLPTAQYRARAMQQRDEQGELVARQLEQHAAKADAMAFLVDVECADVTPGFAIGSAHPPQPGAHARNELAWRKWLGDIIIRAQLETDDPVDLVGARREEDHRNVAELPQFPADVEPAHVRQSDIEHHDVDAAIANHRQDIATQHAMHGVQAFASQRVNHRIGDRDFVFGNQHLGHRHSISAGTGPPRGDLSTDVRATPRRTV